MNNLQLLTIIVQETLAESIQQEIMELGAKGYTQSTVSGKGLSGTRNSPWEGENVKIETVVPQAICEEILDHLQKKYFERYAIIAFYHAVNVVRNRHF